MPNCTMLQYTVTYCDSIRAKHHISRKEGRSRWTAGIRRQRQWGLLRCLLLLAISHIRTLTASFSLRLCASDIHPKNPQLKSVSSWSYHDHPVSSLEIQNCYPKCWAEALISLAGADDAWPSGLCGEPHRRCREGKLSEPKRCQHQEWGRWIFSPDALRVVAWCGLNLST